MPPYARRTNGDSGNINPRHQKSDSTEQMLAARLSLDGETVPRKTGLYLPPKLPFGRWRHIGRQLYLISNSTAWWLGDWLIYGEDEYSDRYVKAIEDTGLNYQTL